jgi:hypothetical protein
MLAENQLLDAENERPNAQNELLRVERSAKRARSPPLDDSHETGIGTTLRSDYQLGRGMHEYAGQPPRLDTD